MRKREKIIALSILGNVFLWGTHAFADTDKLIVSVGLKEEYNDNIFFETTQEKDDFITTVSPGVELLRKDERTSASLEGIFDVVTYSDYSDLNNVDQLYRADITHALTPRLTLAGNASFKRDSRADRDIEETGLELGTDVRKTQRYAAGVGYVLTEKANLNLEYAYNKEDFDDPSETEFNAHKVNAELNYDLSYWFPLTTGRIATQYAHYNYQSPETDIDNYSLTMGFEKQWTEIYSFYADVGARYTDPDVGDESLGSVVRGGLVYDGELTTARASFSHDVRSASGKTGLRERTTFKIFVHRKISEYISARLSGAYHLNKSDRGELSGNDEDRRTIQITPRLNYRLSEHVKFDAGYTYTHILDKETSGDDTKDKNLVFVRLVFDHVFFE